MNQKEDKEQYEKEIAKMDSLDMLESLSTTQSIREHTNGKVHNIPTKNVIGTSTIRLNETNLTLIPTLIDHYKHQLRNYTGFLHFEEIFKANKREMSKNSFYNTIIGKSNLLFLFTTANCCSFGVFESRQIPNCPEGQNETNFSRGNGYHCIFSLDNPIGKPFKIERRNRFFLFNFFDSKPFIGLSSRKNEETLLEIKNFLMIATTSCGAFMPERYKDQYLDNSDEGVENFEVLRGKNFIYFDHFMVYQCYN